MSLIRCPMFTTCFDIITKKDLGLFLSTAALGPISPHAWFFRTTVVNTPCCVLWQGWLGAVVVYSSDGLARSE
eukprot:3981197-Heterocapsa_arctica.AAC.2